MKYSQIPILNHGTKISHISMKNFLPPTIQLMVRLVLTLTMYSCIPQGILENMDEEMANPTPTLFGTAVKTPTIPMETLTPETTSIPDVCVFPVDPDESGVFSEAALYRIYWKIGGDTLILDTRGGPLTLQAPVNMVAGERKLIIAHRGEIPATLQLPTALDSGGTMLFDTGSGATEIRDSNNLVRSQIIHDPRYDVGGAKEALDIISVERKIAEAGGFVIRLTTAAEDNGDYPWSFENIEMLLGNERYARRILQSGKVVKLFYDAEGNYSVWEGTLIEQANTLTWAMEEGAGLPFGARSATSATRVDSTGIFRSEIMHQLWQAAVSSCG